MASNPPAAASSQPPPPPPPPLPPPPPTSGLSGPDESVRVLLSLSRTLALLLALLAGVLFLAFLVLGVLNVLVGAGTGAILTAVYCLASAVVNYVLWREIPGLERLAAERRYGALRDHLIVWAVLGLVFFVVVGVLLVVVLVRTELLVAPPPAGSPAPGAAAAVTGPPGGSVSCPRCGGPTTWIAEYRRNYCYRCSAYV